MSKRLILVLAFALVLGLSLTAYAEVQNIKVSGDVTAVGIYRNNLDLAKPATSQGNGRTGLLGPTINTGTYDDKAELIATITRLRVDADLTDNVIATVRLINQREWNGQYSAGGVDNNNIGLNNANAVADRIEADLVYATLKEFLYSPLTVRAGRQELRFQNGFVIGDPETNVVDTVAGMAAGDLSAHKAFDAIRATLDYNPLVVDLVYAKVSEGVAIRNDDITLSGVNAAYQLDKETMLEGFLWIKTRGTDSGAVTNVDSGNATSFTGPISTGTGTSNKTDEVYTMGARVVNTSVNNLTLDVLAAAQVGTYNPKWDVNARFLGPGNHAANAQTAKRNAYAIEAAAIYNLKDVEAIAKYHPMIMAAYVYLSGEQRKRVGSQDFHGWDPMFEDQTFGHLVNAMFGFSNISLGGLTASFKPTEDTSAKIDWVAAWFNKKFDQGDTVNLSGVNGARTFYMANKSHVGQEVDVTVSYDYTEDVQFSLLGGIFLPGKAFTNRNAGGGARPDKTAATELIGSMKVTF